MTHPVPGRRAVAEALSSPRPVAELLVDERARDVDALLEAARRRDVPVRQADASALDGAAGGVRHQGVVALADPPRRASLADLAGEQVLVVCDGITDPHNLGAIARTAEAAGAGGLVLPRRRRSPITPAAEKASAGAFSWLAVAEVAGVAQALRAFTQAGRWSVGLDEGADVPLWECPVLAEPVALVVGAEGAGLARLVRERCDVLAGIPTVGHVGSLNASVAAGVALMEVRRRLDAPRT